jgi:hypothetical protein
LINLDLDNPSRQRVGLSGVDGSGFVDFNAFWGMVADLSYARTGNVLGTGHSGNVLTGPVFYPAEDRNARIFVHTLAGVSLVDSAVPLTGTYYLGGPVAKFSFAIGGGVERHLSGPLTILGGGDSLRNHVRQLPRGDAVPRQSPHRHQHRLPFREPLAVDESGRLHALRIANFKSMPGIGRQCGSLTGTYYLAARLRFM